jgi:hypothetical protein
LGKPVLKIAFVNDDELLLFKQTYLRWYAIVAGERGVKYPLSAGKWYLTN